MHLWNEYEGRTLAGTYTLGKLLRSEGRNGFFSTSTDKGNSAVIRVTEAHFDEEEQLKRWRQIANVHQSNLIEIENMGKTNFDGVALTYALMEANDANLSDVLQERPLTPAETLEVAKSVIAALRALHTNGLVHEHIDPSNVLAVGDVVKLRSDCVRECVVDLEFNPPEACEELRKRDLHDYGMLLLQCLTLEKEWTSTTNVPEPFRRVIPRAIDGSITAEQIAAIVDPSSVVPQAVTATAARATSNSPAGSSAAPLAHTSPAPAQTLVPPAVREATAANLAARDEAQYAPEPTMGRRSSSFDTEPVTGSGLSMGSIWAICGASAVVLLLLIWHFVSPKSGRTSGTVPQATMAQPAAPAVTPTPPNATTTAPQPIVPADAPTAPMPPVRTVATGPGWYVVAFTYYRADQAQHKADRINEHHAGLHAEVFSPSGRAPYLVALNGPMNQDTAEATWRRARRSGMPRDTFVRHY